MISVQQQDFDLGAEYQKLKQQNAQNGAIVTFCGLVRDFNQDFSLQALELEYYPGMTEKVLEQICVQARERWKLGDITLIHRVGRLEANEQIVFVGVSSQHRQNAFDGAQFIMDRLKNDAPFWKKEWSRDQDQWVAAKLSDQEKARRWESE